MQAFTFHYLSSKNAKSQTLYNINWHFQCRALTPYPVRRPNSRLGTAYKPASCQQPDEFSEYQRLPQRKAWRSKAKAWEFVYCWGSLQSSYVGSWVLSSRRATFFSSAEWSGLLSTRPCRRHPHGTNLPPCSDPEATQGPEGLFHRQKFRIDEDSRGWNGLRWCQERFWQSDVAV